MRMSAPTADQPISTGNAPATAPTAVLALVRDLSGVYTATYNSHVSSPNSAVSGFTNSARYADANN